MYIDLSTFMFNCFFYCFPLFLVPRPRNKKKTMELVMEKYYKQNDGKIAFWGEAKDETAKLHCGKMKK